MWLKKDWLLIKYNAWFLEAKRILLKGAKNNITVFLGRKGKSWCFIKYLFISYPFFPLKTKQNKQNTSFSPSSIICSEFSAREAVNCFSVLPNLWRTGSVSLLEVSTLNWSLKGKEILGVNCTFQSLGQLIHFLL